MGRRVSDMRQQGAVVRQLSRHFVQRWTQRVGAAPSVEGVNRIIEKSSQIRDQDRFIKEVAGQRRVIIQLAEYWYHPGGLIIKVDERNGMAVTVITP
ncbi:MAG: hypothetical protein ABFD97_12830 [Syntrophobacter sp.]